VQLESKRPALRVDIVVRRGEAEEFAFLAPRINLVEVCSESEGFALIVLVCAPVHSKRDHVAKEILAKGGDERILLASIEHIERESVVGVELVGFSVQSAALVVDLLTCPSEGVASFGIVRLDDAILLDFS
jgi:hypothetical protein